MSLTIGALLALSFLISVLGLFMFIWAQMNGLMRAGPGSCEAKEPDRRWIECSSSVIAIGWVTVGDANDATVGGRG